MTLFVIALVLGVVLGLGAAYLWHIPRGESTATRPDPNGRFLDVVHDGLIVLSDGQVMMANAHANQFLGLETSASFERLRLAIRRIPELTEYIEAWRRGNEPGETVIEVGYPQPRYLRVQGAHLRDPEIASEDALLLTLTDVSELQRLEQIRRRFTADISHQIRTPVTAIRLLAEQMAMGTGDPGELTNRVLRETDRLQRLADEILTLSRLESGEEIPDIQEFAVGDLLEEAIDAAASYADGSGVVIEADYPEDEWWCGDYRKLLRALGIYVDNAVKFSPPGGKVRIEARTKDGSGVVTVSDSGPGIPVDELPQVFHRFYRGTRG
ncbi:MAG: sensor histidine kinase, partial [Bacillota bacterium]